jgi:Single-strand binding protein family
MRLIFFNSALAAHTTPPALHRSSQFSRAAFSAAHFSGHCFRLISASCSFASSAFPVPPLHHWVPSHKAAARFGSSSPRFWVPQKNGQKKETFSCPTYMLSGIGLVLPPDVSLGLAPEGAEPNMEADPEQRQARKNGSKFTVLSVATQRSRKNAEDEWASKVEWHRVATHS